MNTEIQLLKDPLQEPNDIIIKAALGDDCFDVFSDISKYVSQEMNCELVWNYYKDGKAWLCKVVFKRKTLFWMSIFDEMIKISFYFTEKTKSGIIDLSINDSIKQNFQNAKTIGKLIPLSLNIKSKSEIEDLKIIVCYKKNSI